MLLGNNLDSGTAVTKNIWVGAFVRLISWWNRIWQESGAGTPDVWTGTLWCSGLSERAFLVYSASVLRSRESGSLNWDLASISKCGASIHESVIHLITLSCCCLLWGFVNRLLPVICFGVMGAPHYRR
jgi:hypothetical protein